MTEPRRKSPLRAAWPWLLLAGAVALWTFVGRGGSLVDAGEAAPPLEVPWTGSDAPFSLAEARGEPVVLAFWATWCPACRQEGPVLSQVAERGHRVVGVSVDEAPLASVAEAARGYGMTYPIALGTRADAERFGVTHLPTVYVVGSDGRVAASFTGPVGEGRLLDAIESADVTRGASPGS